MQIKWLRRAIRNLEQAHKHILKDNPEAAQEVIFKINCNYEVRIILTWYFTFYLFFHVANFGCWVV